MAHEMYFIPILLDAFDAPDVRQALDLAFDEIQRLGCQPGYESGFNHFQEFLELVAQVQGVEAPEDLEAAALEALVAELEQPAQRGTLAELLEAYPEMRRRYERLADALDQDSESQSLELVVQHGEDVLGSFDVLRGGVLGRFGGVHPGYYRISLSSGRVLWDGEIAESDVIIAGRPLELAADTGEPAAEASRDISLMNGEIMMCVYPGIESGTVVIERMR